MRLTSFLVAGLATFMMATVASAALTVTATPQGGASLTLLPGESVTIDVVIATDSNPSPPNAFQTGEALAIGLRAANYDPSVLSGSAVVPAEVLQNLTFQAFGLANNADGSQQDPQAGVRVGTSVNLIQALNVAAAGGSGPDPAIPVTFTALAPGVTTIDFGVFADYSDAYSVIVGNDNSVTNSSLTITVVPEPGTALLMGLGLAGLAAAGRKE